MGFSEHSGDVGRQVQRLTELLQRERGIIASTDLDGLLTSALLESVSGWRLVGFFDSRDSLWLSSARTLEPDYHVFVDVHLSRLDWVSIDQHIVALDTEEAAKLSRSGNKINPNLARNTVFSDSSGRGFTKKYPFATFHYLLALLEAGGFAVKLDLLKPISDGLTLMDLVLRADGAAENTRNYASNAEEWWAWLRALGGPLTHNIATAAHAVAHSPVGFSAKKRQLQELFGQHGCATSDANFSNVLKEDATRVPQVVDSVFAWFGRPSVADSGPFVRSIGTHVRVAPMSRDREVLATRNDLFTYAFTGMRSGGFSATLLDAAAETRPEKG